MIKNLWQNLRKYTSDSWEQGTQINSKNIFAAVYLGGSAHFFLYFTYKYWFGLNENIYLRVITVFLCVSVGAYKHLSEKVRKYWFPFYWHLMLITALPFMLTFNLFNTNFHEAWLYWDIFMVFLLALYVPSWLIYSIDLIIGVGLAFLVYVLIGTQFYSNPKFDVLAYLIVFIFSAVAGMCFIYANRAAWLEKQAQQHEADSALAGNIAHDIRSFLFRLKGLFGEIFFILRDRKTPDGSIVLESSDIKKLIAREKSSYITARHAERNIDDILNKLSGKPIDRNAFEYFSANEIAQNTKDEFGYKEAAHKAKVKLDLKSDFIVKIDNSLMFSVLSNLIKNSFDFLYKKPSMEITIGTETTDDKNIIYIYDTGIGMDKDFIKNELFKGKSLGKIGGTGLGVPSCKRLVEDMGGELICDSMVGEYTKFSLIFPTLPLEESAQAHELIKQRKEREKKENPSILAEVYNLDSGSSPAESMIRDYSSLRILMIDDMEVNSISAKGIAKRKLGITNFDYVTNSDSAIERLKSKEYELILLDFNLQGSRLQGEELITQIRRIEHNQNALIFCVSAATSDEKEKFLEIGMNDHVGKDLMKNLKPAIEKWFYQDKWFKRNELDPNHSSNQSVTFHRTYPNLSVLIIDDFHFNYEFVKSHLRDNCRVKVLDACDSEGEAFAILNQRTYDLILLDLDFVNDRFASTTKGFDIAKAIRQGKQLVNFPQNKEAVIFLSSGRNDEKTKQRSKEIGMDDSIGKFDLTLLDQALARWFGSEGQKKK